MKKIGIVGWKTGENSFGTTIPYLHYLSKFGSVEILTPKQEIRKDLDLLVLPGGKDVDPTRYGQAPSFHNTDSNQYLEYFDQFKLQKYIDAKIPVFGICRGFQTLNVHFGGNLIQHHLHGYSSKNRSEIIHKLDFNELYRIAVPGILKYGKIDANSLHHQVVSEYTIAESLIPTLFSEKETKKNNVVEGFIHNELLIAGVQYHPEEIYTEPYSDYIISCFLKKERPDVEGEVI